MGNPRKKRFIRQTAQYGSFPNIGRSLRLSRPEQPYHAAFRVSRAKPEARLFGLCGMCGFLFVSGGWGKRRAGEL